jgi:hypothetical protein
MHLTPGLFVTFLVIVPPAWASVSPAQDNKEEKLGHGYTRKAGHIYFEGRRIDQEGRHDIDRFAKAVGHPLTLCKDVDAASFAALSRDYTKDKNKVYYRWISPGRFWVVELPTADPATFAVLDSDLAKDAKRVWKGDHVIDGADAATARVVRPHWTWKDRNRVYYQAEVIKDADPATFRHLGQGFYRDAKRVWWCTIPLPGADPDSFQTYGDDSPYARDRSHVWSGNSILEGVEAKSFELVHEHVFKDARRVYAGTKAMEVLNADPASFAKMTELGDWKAALLRDRLRHYVYDPSYGDVYSFERKDGEVEISKPVWMNSDDGRGRVVGATIKARLKGEILSEPELSLETAFSGTRKPEWEKDKIKSLSSLFVKAQRQLESAQDAASKHQIPAEVLSLLEKAESFELISLDPDSVKKNPPKEGYFLNWKVLGKTPVKEPATRRALLDALRAGVREHQTDGAGCFHPRHAIHAASADKVVDIVICFECWHIYMHIDGKKLHVTTTEKPQATLDKILKDAGVPLPAPAKKQ